MPGAHGDFLPPFLTVLLTVLVGTGVFVPLARKYFGQAQVTGEMIVGILFGVLVFGPLQLLTEWSGWALLRTEGSVVNELAHLGLCFLSFQIGLEFEWRVLKKSLNTVAVVGISAIAVPLGLGFATAQFFYPSLPEPRPSPELFQRFFAITLSITAMPVLGRVFLEFGKERSRVFVAALGAAVVNDIIGWLLLGVATTAHRSGEGYYALVPRFMLLTAILALIVLTMGLYLRRRMRRNRNPDGQSRILLWVVISLLVACVASGVLTGLAPLGAFALGFSLSSERDFIVEWKHAVSSLVNTLFVPLFFVQAGFRIRLDSLGSASALTQGIALCVIAFAGKFLSSYCAARVMGESPRNSMVIGVSMNTRGVMELLVLAVAYEHGIIRGQVYSLLVLMSLLSTFLAPIVLRWIIGRT